MDGRLLVAYATKHGSTREVAERIGEVIDAGGASVEVRPADVVVQLDGYDAVVLGGSLYMARWHKGAHRFLSRFEPELAERPLAVFALGPVGDEPVDPRQAREQLDKALERHHGVQPVAVEVFGGRIDPSQLPFPFSRMAASDARDWDVIEAWAKTLPELLESRSALPV
jgi:menaquinone-dependent protoporphyrinogen oxidase